MDGDARLAALLDACRDGNATKARDRATDLYLWFEKGGALPKDPRGVMLDVEDRRLISDALRRELIATLRTSSGGLIETKTSGRCLQICDLGERITEGLP